MVRYTSSVASIGSWGRVRNVISKQSPFYFSEGVDEIHHKPLPNCYFCHYYNGTPQKLPYKFCGAGATFRPASRRQKKVAAKWDPFCGNPKFRDISSGPASHFRVWAPLLVRKAQPCGILDYLVKNRMSIAAACARVAVPWGANRSCSIPWRMSLPTAHAMASLA